MGYACPVCDTPQRDGEHLAHHLAFTAMLHGGDHADWLDERVDDWSEREPAQLAAEVTPHADDAEYDEVFEDTVPRGRPDVGMGSGGGAAGHEHAGHDHADHGHGADPDPASGAGVPDPESVDDPEVAEALREAREMTRKAQEQENDTDADADDPDSADDDRDS
ncbi:MULTISPECIES: DUF5810 domain-containing protein [Halorubrum]|uniref:Uncharacterized protein n=1 Tax=Halorubrum ruber TaxID=2982524 RepID=A0A8T8LMK4_9EURY|nr:MULTISPECIES: DUF5810 domain-containing protein [Halorubrum]QUO48389.1 hypothetical protein J7656_03270 [Halorubrum ruber]